jgi:hypothetical protein
MEQLKKMSEAKWMTIGFVAIGALCCCMAVAAIFGGRLYADRMTNMVKGEPTSIAEIQSRIVEFDTPPGYSVSAIPMFVYDMIMITPDEIQGPMILLMQYSTLREGDQEQVAESLREAAENQSSQGIPYQEVGSFEVVIRGETSTVIVSEGDMDGYVIRRWMTVFGGNNGPVILMIQGSDNSWDEDMLRDFIASIR